LNLRALSAILQVEFSCFEECKDKITPLDKVALRQWVTECSGDVVTAMDRIVLASVDEIDYFAAMAEFKDLVATPGTGALFEGLEEVPLKNYEGLRW
jgi:hypothetical protein